MNITVKIPKPYSKQLEIIKDKSRFKVVCAGRRVGKSTLCKIVTIKNLLDSKRVCYIVPEYGLAEKFYEGVVMQLPPEVIKQQNKSRLELKLITGGELKFFSGEALNRSRGWEFDLLIVDEAAYIDDLKTEWDLSLRPLLTKTQGDAIFISTPRGKNYFYSLFQKGMNEEDNYKSWQFSTHFNPYIPKEELEELARTLPESAYRQEILGEPGDNTANPFGTDAIIRNTQPVMNTQAVVYGIDFGRVNDHTVITGLDVNGNTCYFDRFKLPWEQTIERVKKLREIDPYTLIVCDSTGVGSVLLERLQVYIYNVVGFEFTGKSKPIIIHDLIKDVETNQIKFNEITAQEMNTFEFKYTSGGNLSYNAASGYHDDCIASIAMANFYRKRVTTREDSLYVF